VDRRDIGSWLQGPKAALEVQGIELGYPGERFGLPQVGPNSVARMGRRLVALVIDWFSCVAIAGLIQPDATYNQRSLNNLITFFIAVTVLTSISGCSFGQRIMGIRLTTTAGRPLNPLQVAARTALLCAVVPALIWDRDGRGLHDRAVGSISIRVR
jgi:uncharacterized RDD family membrane protein YckC